MTNKNTSAMSFLLTLYPVYIKVHPKNCIAQAMYYYAFSEFIYKFPETLLLTSLTILSIF
jgi:hypothetical protein